MSIACHGFVYGLEKEIGRREKRKGKEFLVYRVGIRIELRTKKQ
jgi:hypothetical protein